MTLVQLRSLCLIAEEGSFSRAAEQMCLSQPALSMQIRALEEEVGHVLLDRTGKKITLTQPGAVLVAHAKDALAELDGAVQEINRVGGLEHGQLSIASSDTVGEFLLLPVLTLYSEAYPGVSVTVHNKSTVQIEQLVLENVAELGLVSLPVSAGRLESRTLLTYHELALCSPTHPLASRTECTIHQLAEHRLLMLPPTTRTRSLQERDLARTGADRGTVTEVGSVHLQVQFARAGLGVAIVPEYAVQTEIESGRLVPLSVIGLSLREVGIIQRKSRPLSAAAKTFLELLLDSAQRHQDHKNS